MKERDTEIAALILLLTVVLSLLYLKTQVKLGTERRNVCTEQVSQRKSV